MPWLRQLFALIIALGLTCTIWGQTARNISSIGQGLPPELVRQLDSLRKADNLTQWLYTCMDYKEADVSKYLSFLEKVKPMIWRDCRTDSECLARFYFPVTVGYWQLYSGNILRSIDAYEEAYRLYSDRTIRGADVLEYVLKPLGNNYTRLGDYDRALFIQQKGLSIALNENNKEQAASFYSNLAITSLSKGELDQALQYSKSGLQVVKKDTSLYGFLLSTLAEVYFKSKQLTEAENAIKEAIHVLQTSMSKNEDNTPYWLSTAYLTQGEIFKEKGDLNGSLQSYQKGEKFIDTYFKGERKREKAKMIVGSGTALLLLNQPQNAIANYNKALAILLPGMGGVKADALPAANQLYGENTLLDAIYGKARCLLTLNKREQALQCFMLLFTVEEKLRYEFFSTAAKQQQQKESREWVEMAVETSYQLWKTTGDQNYARTVFLLAEKSKARLLLDEIASNLYYNRINNRDPLLQKQWQAIQTVNMYEKDVLENRDKSLQADSLRKDAQYELSLIQKQVKDKYPMVAELEQSPLSTINGLLENLALNTTVLEYFAGEKAIYIIEAVKGKIVDIRKLDNASDIKEYIKEFVFKWFQQGPDKMINNPQGYYKQAYILYHLLYEGARLDPSEHCLIIPDGIIGYLPFDALVTDSVYKTNVEQWPFLIKKSNLYYSYSLQTWQQQQQIKRTNQLFAGFFISFDNNKQTSIPAVKKEYKAIRNAVNGDFFLEQKASYKEFTDHLKEVNVLHISTHSFLQEQDNIPVLQLADDKLFLFELYGKYFQPQLVVLSACRTGHGILAEGEGIISLARGFIATGAGGIVAGLWNMNDESTAQLMGAFYGELTKDHQPADALHAAKLQWLQKQSAQSIQKLPYYWAGLIYSGDNEPVYIEKNKRSNIVWIAVAIAATLLVVYIGTRKTSRQAG
jgi:CHAT domain-containing protein